MLVKRGATDHDAEMKNTTPLLNRNAHRLADAMIASAARLNVRVHQVEGQATIIDCGVEPPGSLEAGILLARVCAADLAQFQYVEKSNSIEASTDDPVRACLCSQYAGWRLAVDDYFAIGSGPMRLAAAAEPLFAMLGAIETADSVVGVLEARALPTQCAVAEVARRCHVPPDQVTLLVAPTASWAGTVQIVARSIETALHKLHELQFDVRTITRGEGNAPLPPIPKREAASSDSDQRRADMIAMGCTNDAVIYGGEVRLWCDCPDPILQQIIDRVPSSASSDYGRPFAKMFAAYEYDFYKVDKLLFSPAKVTLISNESGEAFSAGQIHHELVAHSFEAAK